MSTPSSHDGNGMHAGSRHWNWGDHVARRKPEAYDRHADAHAWPFQPSRVEASTLTHSARLAEVFHRMPRRV